MISKIHDTIDEVDAFGQFVPYGNCNSAKAMKTLVTKRQVNPRMELTSFLLLQ